MKKKPISEQILRFDLLIKFRQSHDLKVQVVTNPTILFQEYPYFRQ